MAHLHLHKHDRARLGADLPRIRWSQKEQKPAPAAMLADPWGIAARPDESGERAA